MSYMFVEMTARPQDMTTQHNTGEIMSKTKTAGTAKTSRLRGAKPTENASGRLKALFFGAAGVGKTTAAIAMPNPYVIDCESGTDHYREIIARNGGAIFSATSMSEVIDETRALMTEEHEYLTLVIDPFTMLYDQAVEEGGEAVGTSFGKDVAYANKQAKRLYRLLSAIDMNVICVCHAKAQYDQKGNKIDDTFDGWKRLDYLFDLSFEIKRDPRSTTQRLAVVKKTRLASFPDQSTFVWSYAELERRLTKGALDRRCARMELASEDELTRFLGLYAQLNDEDRRRLGISKVIENADEARDLPRARLLRGIEVMEKALNPETAA